MKRWIVVLGMVLAVTPLARADEASKRAKVQELITAMHMDRMMAQMMDAMKAQTQKMLQQTPGEQALTPEQKRLVAKYENQSIDIITSGVGWKAMEPDFVNVYMQTFTEDEINGITAFYQSPAGQAMLTKMPQLMTASMTIAQSRMKDIQPKLQALQEQLMKDMAAAAPAKTAAPAPKPKS